MAEFKVQEQNNIISFNLNKTDPNEYQNQKLDIENYLKSINHHIIHKYGDYTLKVIPIIIYNIPSYWCGYIICNNKNKLNQIVNSKNIHGGWTYNEDNQIGFDCIHYNDLGFRSGINDLDNFNNRKLERYTYKSPQWVLQQLKDCLY